MNRGFFGFSPGEQVIQSTLIGEIHPTTPSGKFNNIPQHFSSLRLEYALRSNVGSTQDYLYIYFNGDTTTTNYRRIRAWWYANTSGTTSGADVAHLDLIVTGANAAAGSFTTGSLRIPFFAKSTMTKQVFGFNSCRIDTTTTHELIQIVALNWESTRPIRSITLSTGSSNVFVRGSTIRLIGEYP